MRAVRLRHTLSPVCWENYMSCVTHWPALVHAASQFIIVFRLWKAQYAKPENATTQIHWLAKGSLLFCYSPTLLLLSLRRGSSTTLWPTVPSQGDRWRRCTSVSRSFHWPHPALSECKYLFHWQVGSLEDKDQLSTITHCNRASTNSTLTSQQLTLVQLKSFALTKNHQLAWALLEEHLNKSWFDALQTSNQYKSWIWGSVLKRHFTFNCGSILLERSKILSVRL